ncbi:ribosome-inactivating family protein, partial [Escherichia coli]
MKIIIFRVLTFFFVIFSVNVVAKEFTLDFSTAKTYVDSLNVIRSAIGTPLQTISSGGTSLLMIDSGTGDNLFAVDVRGIDPEEGRFNNLRLIVERNNLYVTGFVNRTNNVFYRFADFSHVTFPGTTAVTLSGDSSYTTLQRVAGISRTGMQINRHSLTTSYLDLMSHSGTSLTQSVARAMLRFVTVTAEALRFRQIQRGFRTTLDDLSGRSYVMTAEDVDLTLNWGRLSSVLPDYHGQDSVRVGRISFGSV